MSHLLFDIKDHIATLTFNQPDKRNAYSPEMAVKLTQYLRECDKNPEVRVVIITGAGDAFCVGLDLNDVRERGNKAKTMKPTATQLNECCAPIPIRSPSRLFAPSMAPQAASARPTH